MKNCKKFLEEHNITSDDIDFQQVVDLFTTDMLNGLQGKP